MVFDTIYIFTKFLHVKNNDMRVHTIIIIDNTIISYVSIPAVPAKTYLYIIRRYNLINRHLYSCFIIFYIITCSNN